MEVRYKRSMGFNYMILQEQGAGMKDSYQMHIFLDNQVPGLLPCKVERVNGEALFYYEISGCQNVQHLFEKEKFKKRTCRSYFLLL